MAESFDFRLNPASAALLMLKCSGGPPARSMGPTASKFMESVPPLSREPVGNFTPTAGSIPSRSSTGMDWPSSFMWMVVVSFCIS